MKGKVIFGEDLKLKERYEKVIELTKPYFTEREINEIIIRNNYDTVRIISDIIGTLEAVNLIVNKDSSVS